MIELGVNGSVTLKDYLSLSEKNRIKVLFGDRTPPVPGTDGVKKTGTAGKDTLDGNDILIGGTGADTLKGGQVVMCLLTPISKMAMTPFLIFKTGAIRLT